MQREIKFRAWDKNARIMRNWDEIILEKEQGNEYYLLGYKLNRAITSYDHEQILMQYTGLKDDNGTEIYEGDIVKTDNGINKVIGIVRFGKYEQDGSGGEYNPATCIGFYFDRLKTIPNEWERENDFIWEVDCEKTTSLLCYVTLEKIGNIYENPELLEAQKNDKN